MTIKVANGRITLQLSTADTFVGSTSAGEYPPVGQQYRHFDCKPAEKSGVIVFNDVRSIGSKEEPWYTFHQFTTTDDNKIIVTYKLDNWKRPFQQIKGMGLVVQGQKWTYVTTVPVGKEGNYILVDIIDMLKYIEGRITIDQLRRRAKQREEVKIKREQLHRVTQQRDFLETENGRLMDRYRTDRITIQQLRESLWRSILFAQVIKRALMRRNWFTRWRVTSMFKIPGPCYWDFMYELRQLTALYDPEKPWFKTYPDLTK
ncbi:MAG: hypothetical protein V4682_00670 [Patescibacteria group bacterium]